MSSPENSTDELREAIREVLSHRSESYLSDVRSGRLGEAERALWAEAAQLGWLGLGVEERYGGLGLGFAGLAVLYEELGRALAPLPVLSTLLAAEAFSVAGTDELKEQWLPRIASGEIRAAIALPVSGQTLPRVAADGGITGSVPNVLRGETPDLLLLPVRSESGRVSLAIFGCEDAGIAIQATPVIDLTRMLCTVNLDRARVAPACLLDLDDAQWNRLLNHASVALACDSVGGADEILARTVAYMGVRMQFGRPIGSFQALKHRAATWKIVLEGARALTGHAAGMLARQDPGASACASAAKASACDVYTAIAGDAIQLHGGIGFTWEHDCHLFIKRARLNAVLFGTPVQHRERVAGLAFADVLGPQFERGALLIGAQSPGCASAATGRC